MLSGANPQCTLYNTVASACKFMWWIVTDLLLKGNVRNFLKT